MRSKPQVGARHDKATGLRSPRAACGLFKPCGQGLHRPTKAAHLQRNLVAAAFAVLGSEQELQRVEAIAVMIALLGRIPCQCHHPVGRGRKKQGLDGVARALDMVEQLACQIGGFAIAMQQVVKALEFRQG